METMLFESFDPSAETNKSFLRDLTVLLELPRKIVASLEEEYLKDAKIVRPMRREEKAALAAKLEISLTKLSASWDVLGFLTIRLSEKKCEHDTPDGLASDLIELAPSASFDKKILTTLFSELKERIVPAYEETKKKRISSVTVLPHLQGVTTSVEICPVTERSFELGDSTRDYDPEISAYTPAISVRLRSTSLNMEEFVFQASPESLKLLIERLEAALIDVEAFEKFIKKT